MSIDLNVVFTAKKLAGPKDNRHCSHSPHSTSIGLGLHRAPELIEKQPYTKKSDLYGLGIIFLEMLLSHIETAHERIITISNIKKGVFPDGWENKFETTILKKLLAESPHARPDTKELLELISTKVNMCSFHFESYQ